MTSTIKTIILAATGAAVILATPALAQTKRAAGVQYTTAPIAQPFVQVAPQNWTNGNDQFGQIRNEYLKDAPTHNGNSY
jgi:hypothetical protein